MQERTIPFPVTIGLLVMTVVGVGVFMKTKEHTQIVPAFPAMAEAATDTRMFTAIPAADWHYTALAERDIQAVGTGQRILDGVVSDPLDGAIAYFAAAAFDDTTEKMTLSIYRYNMQRLTFTRLAKTTYGKGTSRTLANDTWPVWQAIGYDNHHLVILLRDVNDEEAFCDIPLLLPEDRPQSAALFAFNLTDPASGLAPYAPHEDDITAAHDAHATCAAANTE